MAGENSTWMGIIFIGYVAKLYVCSCKVREDVAQCRCYLYCAPHCLLVLRYHKLNIRGQLFLKSTVFVDVLGSLECFPECENQHG